MIKTGSLAFRLGRIVGGHAPVQLSLAHLLIVVGVLGGYLGMWGRDYREQYRFDFDGTATPGVAADAMWERVDGKLRLKHMLVRSTIHRPGQPFGMLRTAVGKPVNNGVSFLGSGIYIDGIQRDDGTFGKTWLYRHNERDLVALPIASEVINKLTPDNFDRFPSSDTWRNVIIPAAKRGGGT